MNGKMKAKVSKLYPKVSKLKLRVVWVKAALQQCLAYRTPYLLLNNISCSFFTDNRHKLK